MSAKIIDGRALAASLRAGIAQEVKQLSGAAPQLCVVIVGDDPASQIYVRNKVKGCAEVGIGSRTVALGADTTQQQLLDTIDELNADDTLSGILVQLPLPPQIDKNAVIERIDPSKDVDCFTPRNVGLLILGRARLLPCTPAGVIELIKYAGVTIDGSECVVLGRSMIAGRPTAQLLLAENGTVTVCHTHTRELAEYTRRADILVSAVGRASTVGADMVKPGACVIDVGTNRGADGKLCGDVDFAAVSAVAGCITPVPGGVGPMTITMLLRNTLSAAEMRFGQR